MTSGEQVSLDEAIRANAVAAFIELKNNGVAPSMDDLHLAIQLNRVCHVYVMLDSVGLVPTEESLEIAKANDFISISMIAKRMRA